MRAALTQYSKQLLFLHASLNQLDILCDTYLSDWQFLDMALLTVIRLLKIKNTYCWNMFHVFGEIAMKLGTKFKICNAWMHLNWSDSSFLRLLQLLQQFVLDFIPRRDSECRMHPSGGWTIGRYAIHGSTQVDFFLEWDYQCKIHPSGTELLKGIYLIMFGCKTNQQ